jgi:hypothetical protein
MLADRCAPDLVIFRCLCAAVSDSLPRAGAGAPRVSWCGMMSATHTDAGFMHGIAYARGARAELELAVGIRWLAASVGAPRCGRCIGAPRVAWPPATVSSAARHKRQWIRENWALILWMPAAPRSARFCRDNGLPCVILRQSAIAAMPRRAISSIEFAGGRRRAGARRRGGYGVVVGGGGHEKGP